MKKIGIIGLILVISFIIKIPTQIAKSTYFADKELVEVMYTDSKYEQMYVTKISFQFEQEYHNGLMKLNGTRIPKEEIDSVILIYSPYTDGTGK